MKTIIGILGGMGPLAGVDLHRKLILATPATNDQEHLSVVHVSYSPLIADRTQFLTQSGADPTPGMCRGLDVLLQAGATHIVVACNTAHAPPIWTKLEAHLEAQQSQAKLISMIEVTCGYLQETVADQESIAVLSTLGTYKLQLYQKQLSAAGLAQVALSEVEAWEVHDSIYNSENGIKASEDHSIAAARLTKILDALSHRGATHAVLACTELPLALSHHPKVELIDPAQVLVAYCVREVSRSDR
jgi:aspartate racemase